MRQFLLLTVLLAVSCAHAQEPVSLLSDGAFALDADGNGLADAWQFVTGDDPKLIDATFGREQLAPGRFAQRVTCTRIEGGHAMLAQVGVVSVKAGQTYRLKLRLRGQDLSGLSVALQDTNGWQSCGLYRSLSLGTRWRSYDFKFQADRDCHQTSRFQLWFTKPGTAWVSDVSLTETQPRPPSNVIADDGAKNLLPNSGFEVLGAWGVAGFWTYGWQVAAGQGLGGSNCAAVKWQPNDPEQRYMFDYFDPVNKPLERPALQPIGYLPVQPDQIYVLSAYLRSAREGAPAIVACSGPGAFADQKVRLTREWQLVSVRARAKGPLTLVQIGPDFQAADAAAFDGCTVFIDNAQFERAEAASDFAPKPLEVSLQPADLDFLATPAATTLTAIANVLSAQAGPAAVELKVTDTLDQPVGTVRRDLPLKPGVTVSSFSVPVPGPGFYRLHLSVKLGEQSAQATARRAVCLSAPAKDASAFGINHAYGFDAPMRLAKSLGITWVRDWSLKWEHVEPKVGEFNWQAVDEQIERALRLGMNVLCMFPFPSAEWSSSAPAELKTAGYPGNRVRQAYAPRDPAAMARYMAACVARYKDRIHTWEIFNESLYTDYSLPRKGGYKPEDYLPLLDAASAACKQADPSCQVMGGYSAPPGALDLYGPMFKGGGLGKSDLVSLHIYPGDAPEHLQPDLDSLNAAMDATGGRKPTWMTEFAYYADDDPDPVKVSWPGLVESELVQASWSTRAMVIMLANGVEKVFYHIWPATLNRNVGTEIFFEFAGAPHKIAPAQAALNYFLGPAPRLAAKDAGQTTEDLYCYVFQAPPSVGQLEPSPPGASWVAVVWSSYETLSLPVGPGWRCYDLCGKPLTGAQVAVGPQPIYLCASGASADALARAIAQKLAGQ